MLLGRKREGSGHVIAIVRDLVEIVAIIIAGVWAFYIFAYENRIKPSFANPDIDVTASMHRLGEHNGLVTVDLLLQLHNVGTVKAHFLGIAINVFGQRVAAATPPPPPQHLGVGYEFTGFYHLQPKVPVYTFAYLTHLGDRSTGKETSVDTGSTIDIERIFYVPNSRFDLLTVGFDAPYTKFDSATIPTHLVVTPDGTKVVTASSPRVDQFNIIPVTSLDIR